MTITLEKIKKLAHPDFHIKHYSEGKDLWTKYICSYCDKTIYHDGYNSLKRIIFLFHEIGHSRIEYEKFIKQKGNLSSSKDAFIMSERQAWAYAIKLFKKIFKLNYNYYKKYIKRYVYTSLDTYDLYFNTNAFTKGKQFKIFNYNSLLIF